MLCMIGCRLVLSRVASREHLLIQTSQKKTCSNKKKVKSLLKTLERPQLVTFLVLESCIWFLSRENVANHSMREAPLCAGVTDRIDMGQINGAC